MARSISRAALLGATVLASFGATCAAAQTEGAGVASVQQTEEQEGNSGNEIVVTGSRRSVTLQDAPINISAISEETLARQRIDDVRGLAAFTPGLTIVDTGPASTGNIILRGIESGDTSVNGSNENSAVGVYLGEVPLYLDFKLIDIARVETLLGPQGTLYGLGTLAGAVRYMPNRPNTSRFSVDLHGRGYAQSHSSDFGRSGDVTVNVPILSDHIALRSVVGYYDNAGFIDYNYMLQRPGVSDAQPVRGTTAAQGSLGGLKEYAANFKRKDDVNFEHTFTTRNTLLLEYNPNVKAFLTYAHQDTKTNGRQANGAGVLGTGNYEGPWRYLEPFHRKADLYSAEFNINLFNVAQLVSTTAYTEQKIVNVDDNTDLLLDLDYGYEAFPAFSSFANNHRSYKQFNQEVRLVSSHGGPVNWVIGGFYNRLKYSSDRQEYTPGFAAFAGVNRPDDLEYISFVNTKTVEKAVYGEATLHATSAWQVTGGLRYFKYDATATGGTDTPLFGGGLTRTPYPLIQFAPSRVASGQAGDDGFVWKANTSYKFSPELMAYATYSTGYRIGGANRVAPCTVLGPGQNVCALPNERFYKPDKTRNIEVGLRASLFDKRLQFTLDAFRVKWSDVQVPTQTVNGAVGITTNAGSAESKGVEFSGSFKVLPQLTVQGTYSYVDAHLTEDVVDLVVSQGVRYDAKAGDRLPGSTKHSASAQLIYTYPLADGGEIEATWAATYTGDIYSRVGLRGNGEVIPDYLTHRASVTYRGDRFEVGLFADNIFNKYAYTAISNDISSFNQARTGVVERYYARSVLTPRRVGIDFRIHY
ncbi:TonB-dependent receptor [Sphingomonas pituitosa]|uniref:TonB-dependent receptor n=1 Tax=Sphingomonas pituitosa TaxID=99597 RepID=UPI0008302758|nr:TonB-dependent receptor [Sphingomonas pituitosa]